MKNEELLDAIGKIDDKLICDAVNDAPKKKIPLWVKWGSIVACLSLCGLLVLVGINSRQGKLFNEQLPVLDVSVGLEDGYGFEGYYVYSISDLTNGNPWNENVNIATLPVYKNSLADEETRYITTENRKKLTAYLLEVGKKFNLSADDIVVSDDGETPSMLLIGNADKLTISVTAGMTARVAFDSAIPLSNPLYPGSGYAEIKQAAAELQSKYSAKLGIKHPKVNIFGGDYDIDGKEQHYSLSLYEDGGSDIKNILQYNFSSVTFIGDDEGRLEAISFNQADETLKVGDYPIISVEEAKKRLLNEEYITSVTEKISISESRIGKVELVYRRELSDSYIMPYYRYYVDISQENDDLHTYGIYDVSAISGEYLSNQKR